MTAAPFEDLLAPDETLLWQGRIGFNLISSPLLTLALAALAALVVAGFWLAQTPEEFCATDTGGGCRTLYWSTPFAALLIAAAQGFEMLERRALTAGRAQGAVLLTDRRLIRASTWPWRRVRAYAYRQNPPRRWIGGMVRFGTFGASVIVPPEDAPALRALMDRPA